MLFNGLFTQNDIIGVAMQNTVFRNVVIQNNIANADVPGYKRKVVEFEDTLRQAVDKAKKTGRLNLDAAKQPKLTWPNSGYNYRVDKNNVDIETEMVNLYQNGIRYDAMVSGINNNYKRINAVMK